jgi:hypothetical protein
LPWSFAAESSGRETKCSSIRSGADPALDPDFAGASCGARAFLCPRGRSLR